MSEFFTSLTMVDRDTLLRSLYIAVLFDGSRPLEPDVKHPVTLRFLEIGVFFGATAKGIEQWCRQHSIHLEYFGCDDFSHPNFATHGVPAKDFPISGATLIKGASWDVFHKFPDDMDIVFVDGNHSGNAVILDTALYAPKVRTGGFMIFHDTARHIQQTMPEQNAPNHPWWRNSVNAAHALIGWPWKGWKLVAESEDKEANFGGCKVYQKV